jgi:NitT/TauT family transport system substrate-binding protein
MTAMESMCDAHLHLVGRAITRGRGCLPLHACGERSEFARLSRKFRVRGPLRESEPVERPPHPDPLHSPTKTGVNALMASGEREQRRRATCDSPALHERVGFAVRSRLSLITLIATLLLNLATPSLALDTIRLGKAVPNSFAFGAAEVGIEAKIFAGEGLDIAVSSFRGDAQLQQALAAGSVDVGLGSGPGLGFRVKGAPMIGVAAMYGAPRNLALLVSAKSSIRSVADLKGKRIGVTTVGSLTDWLVRELSRQQGWGSDGMVIAPLGQMQARLAAMDRGELDGVVLEAANGYELEEAGRTRNLILFGDIVKHFYTHVIFATDEMVDKRPELLRRFLRGWFKTVAFMKANREFAVKSEQRTLDVRQSVVEKIYNAQMEGFSLDGAWDPEAIDVIRSSLKELGILPTIPDARALYTDRFVPVRF